MLITKAENLFITSVVETSLPLSYFVLVCTHLSGKVAPVSESHISVFQEHLMHA